MTAQARYRRAGSRWRLLVRRMRPGGGNGAAINLLSDVNQRRPPLGDPAREERYQDADVCFSVDQVIAGCEFDELVVGSWLHVEQTDVGRWWMSVGGVVLHVHADRDGRPLEVRVNTDEDPVAGCRYVIDDEEVVST